MLSSASWCVLRVSITRLPTTSSAKKLYSCTVIPNRGAWLEYETDSNDVFYVRVDRTRKVPITVLIRALGIGTNAEILELFGEEPKLLATLHQGYFAEILPGGPPGALQKDPARRAAGGGQRGEPDHQHVF